MDQIFDLTPKEINLLMTRRNERMEAASKGSTKSGQRRNTIDMQDENNLMALEMMMPGSVDFGSSG